MERLERNFEVLSLIDECQPKTLSKKLTVDNLIDTFKKLREEESLVLYVTSEDDKRIEVEST